MLLNDIITCKRSWDQVETKALWEDRGHFVEEGIFSLCLTEHFDAYDGKNTEKGASDKEITNKSPGA